MPENGEKKGKSQVFWIIIILLLFLTLVTVSAVSAYIIMLQPFRVDSSDNSNNEQGPIYTMEEFVVNVGSVERRRICRAVMAFELRDSNVERDIERREAELRNNIISILRLHTMEVLEKKDDGSALRHLITDEMNKVLGEDSIRNTWFTEFFVE